MMTHARISEALRALVFDPEPGVELDEVIDRFYAPEYTHRRDGITLRRDEFAAMVTAIRAQVEQGEVRVLDEFFSGLNYAERHVFDLTLTDGSTQHREIAIFGTHADDGRFLHLSETGFTFIPDERP